MNRAPKNSEKSFSRKILLASTALVAAGAMNLTTFEAKADNPWDLNGTGFTKDTSQQNQTTLTQLGGRAYGEGDLDIEAYERVDIIQNGAGDLFVAKDTKNDPTRILGALNANGQVMILDRNGVFFGAQARIDVGGIIASTGDVDIDALMNGADVIEFTNLGNGVIENQGQISVADAGIAAFVAPTVKNSGVINAKLGKVAFAAGEKVTLDLYGDQLVEIAANDELEDALLENAGTINAEGGVVTMTARAAKDAVDSVINMSGVINASSVTQQGGKIILSGGDSGAVKVSGKMDASGTTGGSIDVTGENVDVAASAELAADGGQGVDGIGNGGQINMIASAELGYHGAASAEGGVNGGQGGFIETSAPQIIIDGTFKVGQGGEVLIDPVDLCVFGAGGVCNVASTVDFIASIRPTLITGGTVTTNNAAGVGQGDIEIVGDLSDGGFTTTSTGTWNIEANDDIFFRGGSNLVVDGAGLNLNLTSLEGVDGLTPYFVSLEGTANINTGGGDITINAPEFRTTSTASLDAAGGDITINNTDVLGALGAETIKTSGTGTIELNQFDGGSIQTAIDAISNTGTGTNTINVGAGTYNESVEADEDNLVLSGAKSGVDAVHGARGTDESVIQPNSPGIHVTADNVVIDGFEIEGGEIGIHVEGAENVSLLNNHIHGQRHPLATGEQAGFRGSGDGILVSHGSSSVLITDNLIEDTDDEAVQVVDSSDIEVFSNTFDNRDNVSGDGGVGNGHEAINFTNVTGESTISYNTIYSGFESAIGVFDSADLLVTGNLIEGRGVDANDYGIRITNSTDTDVIFNVINNTGNAGIYVNGSDGTYIDDATITGTGESGILVNPSSGVVIENSTINSTGSNGITILGSDDAQILNNEIGTADGANNINGDGIYISESDNAVIQGNEITGTTSTAMDIGSGVQVLDSDNALVDDNVIYGTEWDGVRLEKVTNTTVSGNEIDDVAYSGVFLGGVSDTVEITGNDIDGTAFGNGIRAIFSNNLTIGTNEIDNTAKDGISVESSGGTVLVDGNLIGQRDGNIGENGIEVKSTSGAVVSNNEIANAEENGVYVNGSDGTFVSVNTISDVGGSGVLVNPSLGVTVDGNTIDNTGSNGVTLLSSDDAVVVANIIGTNGGDNNINGDGVHVFESDRAVIQGNEITGTTETAMNIGSGVQVLNSDSALVGGFAEGEGNTIYNVAWDGVRVENSDGTTVQGNDIDNFKRSGVFGGKTTNLNIWHNDIDGLPNSTNGIFVLNSDIVSIFQNDVDHTTLDGILANKTTNLTIDENYVGTDGGNIGKNGIEVIASEGAIVSENLVNDTARNGIYIKGSDGAQVVSNTVTNAGWNGVLVNPSSGVLVDGNTIDDVGEDGIHIQGGSENTVSNNFIGTEALENNIGDDGIDIEGSLDAVVTGNIITETVNHGVHLNPLGDEDSYSDNAYVAGNNISNAGGDGVHAYDSYDLHVYNNDINDIVGNGVFVEEGSETIVEMNRIFNVGENGIFLMDELLEGDEEGVEGFDIRDNIIGNAAFDGIKVRDFYAGWIAGNQIGFGLAEGLFPTGVGDDGIDVKGGDYISIYENNIFGAGFYLSGENASWSGADGIRVKDVGGIEFLPPEAVEEDGFGYSFADADVEIFGNTIAFTQDDGIEVIDGNRVHIEGNIAGHIGLNSGNADGIRVIDSSHTVVKSNGVADVLDDGIRVDGGFYAGVFDNHVLRVGDDGIEVSNVHYDEEMPTDAVLADVDYPTVGYPVSIEGNEIVLSGDHGIYVHDSGATRIIDNQVSFAGIGQENVYEAVNDVANDINDLLNYGPVFDKLLVEEYDPEFTLEWGNGDGIKVENVYSDDYKIMSASTAIAGVPTDDDDSDYDYFHYGYDGWSVLIQGNQVAYTGGDGIDVNEAGTTLIGGYEGDANSVYQAGIKETTISGYESFADWTESGPFMDENARRVVWIDGEWDAEWTSGEYGDLTGALYDHLAGGIMSIQHDTHDGIRATNISNDGYFAPRPKEGELEILSAGVGAGSAGTDGGFYGYALNIVGNTVDTTGDDGIEAGWATSALIKDNYVTGAGVGLYDGSGIISTPEYADERVNYGSGDYFGADGISAHNIYGERGVETGSYSGGDYGEGYEEYALVIDGNYVDGTADDGIEAVDAGRTLISNNWVYNNGIFGNGYNDVYDDIDMYDSESFYPGYYATAGDGFGSDGIHARDIYDHTYNYSYEEGVDPETGYFTETYTYSYGNDVAVDIRNNEIDRTGDDGIEVLDSGRTVIDDNDITHAGYGGGYYYGAADGWGADGIHVRNVIATGYRETETEYYEYVEDGYYGYYVYMGSDYSEEDLYNDGTSVLITNNYVDTTADDGIQVLFSGNSVIDTNEVYNAGYGDDTSYEGEGYYDGNGADGIHVLTGFVDGYYGGADPKKLALAVESSSDYFLSTSTEITNNIVDVAGDDGIDVEGVTDVLVDNNDVDNVGDDGIEVVGYFGGFEEGPEETVLFEGELTKVGVVSEAAPFFTATISNNTVDNAGDNGIEVEDLDEFFIQNNTINNVGLDTLGYEDEGPEGGNGIEAIFYGHGQITNNTITNASGDGIFTDGYNDEGVGYSILISGNDIDDVGVHGIDVNYTDMVTISGNEVTDAGEIGILGDYANGSVMFTGNTMTNNPIGAAFNSGVINMIGASNTFNGGQVGLQFNGPDVSLTDNDPLDEFEGSIGTSVFNGQSQYFVELTDGALFEPGQPSLYNALDSSYFFDGSFFSPSDTAGIITLDQLNFLEDMFYHFEDDETLGLFFFGALSIENLEDIFNNYGVFSGSDIAGRLTITGLPTTNQQQTAQLLNDINTAAGGEGGIPGDTNGDGELSAEEAAALDPAAGGQQVGCLSDAIQAVESGVTVNYDFDTSFESTLSDTAGCGLAQNQAQ